MSVRRTVHRLLSVATRRGTGEGIGMPPTRYWKKGSLQHGVKQGRKVFKYFWKGQIWLLPKHPLCLPSLVSHSRPKSTPVCGRARRLRTTRGVPQRLVHRQWERLYPHAARSAAGDASDPPSGASSDGERMPERRNDAALLEVGIYPSYPILSRRAADAPSPRGAGIAFRQEAHRTAVRAPRSTCAVFSTCRSPAARAGVPSTFCPAPTTWIYPILSYARRSAAAQPVAPWALVVRD